MLKRIALTAVLVAGAAFVGATSIAKAKGPQIQVKPQAPRGFCIPPYQHNC